MSDDFPKVFFAADGATIAWSADPQDRQQLSADDIINMAEWDKVLEMRHEADVRAIRRWRAASPGRDLMLPDHADLVLWMIDERENMLNTLGITEERLAEMIKEKQ